MDYGFYMEDTNVLKETIKGNWVILKAARIEMRESSREPSYRLRNPSQLLAEGTRWIGCR